MSAKFAALVLVATTTGLVGLLHPSCRWSRPTRRKTRRLAARTFNALPTKTQTFAPWPLLALFATGCSSPTYLEDLKTPALVWERSRGLCGSGFAVDGNGQLWIDAGGCENGRPELTSRGPGEPSKIDALRRAFEALPKDGGPDRASCGGNVDSFTRTDNTGSVTARACASGSGSDLTGLEEPYLTIAMKFLALP